MILFSASIRYWRTVYAIARRQLPTFSWKIFVATWHRPRGIHLGHMQVWTSVADYWDRIKWVKNVWFFHLESFCPHCEAVNNTTVELGWFVSEALGVKFLCWPIHYLQVVASSICCPSNSDLLDCGGGTSQIRIQNRRISCTIWLIYSAMTKVLPLSIDIDYGDKNERDALSEECRTSHHPLLSPTKCAVCWLRRARRRIDF